MSSHLVFRGRTLSRRRFMSGLAVATAASSTLVLASTAARAEAPEWQEYRDEEMGIRIEMPVKLSFNQETWPDSEMARVRRAKGEFDGMRLSVDAYEYRVPIPVEDFYQVMREGPVWLFPPNREKQLTVSGVPARDFIREADDINYIHRAVIVDNRIFLVFVLGNSVHGNPTVLRILDSMALLRGPAEHNRPSAH